MKDKHPAPAPEPVPAIIADTASAIMTQGHLGEEFRADIEKNLRRVHSHGGDETKTVHQSHPLSDDEIALVRDFLRTAGAAPARTRKKK